MRKLRVSILLTITALLMLVPMIRPTQRVKAWSRETYYTVRNSCLTRPPCFNCLRGEWFRDCDGNMTGWGWEPGHECSYTEITYGNNCGPDVP